jgi:hypothetical protein
MIKDVLHNGMKSLLNLFGLFQKRTRPSEIHLRQEDHEFEANLGYNNKTLSQKTKKFAGIGGSCLKSLLLRKQRSGGSWFEASPGKYFPRSYLKNTNIEKG